jgi:MYXO-CTERM domain-containing protein
MAMPALAVPTFFILQRDTRFTQTGPSTTSADGFLFQGRATPNNGVGPIDFDGGTISFPATSPIPTSPLSPSGAELSYSSGKILDQTTFQTDYPLSGNYTFHMTDSANAAHTQTETVNGGIGTAVATVPQLTAASFNDLQGLDASKAFTVNFMPFADPGPGALIFFAIQDSLGNTPVFDGLQPNVTQDVIPAGTLQPGTQYNFFLFFENNAISQDNIAQVTLDTRTRGSFTTQAVPEAGAGLLAMLTLGGGGVLRRRRR